MESWYKINVSKYNAEQAFAKCERLLKHCSGTKDKCHASFRHLNYKQFRKIAPVIKNSFGSLLFNASGDWVFKLAKNNSGPIRLDINALSGSKKKCIDYDLNFSIGYEKSKTADPVLQILPHFLPLKENPKAAAKILKRILLQLCAKKFVQGKTQVVKLAERLCNFTKRLTPGKKGGIQILIRNGSAKIKFVQHLHGILEFKFENFDGNKIVGINRILQQAADKRKFEYFVSASLKIDPNNKILYRVFKLMPDLTCFWLNVDEKVKSLIDIYKTEKGNLLMLQWFVKGIFDSSRLEYPYLALNINRKHELYRQWWNFPKNYKEIVIGKGHDIRPERFIQMIKSKTGLNAELCLAR